MNPTPTTDTQRLRELLAAATPGPWKHWQTNFDIGIDGPFGMLARTGSNSPAAVYDAELIAALRNEAPALLDEIDRLRDTQERPEINTNVRLFDLVRYMRSELHEAELITDQEYGWLCSSPMACSPKGGSPSRERLEDYDEIRSKLSKLSTDYEDQLKELRIATASITSERDKLREEVERLRVLAYNDPPNEHYPGTTWKDVADWNSFACVENQKLFAKAEAERDSLRRENEELKAKLR